LAAEKRREHNTTEMVKRGLRKKVNADRQAKEKEGGGRLSARLLREGRKRGEKEKVICT